ncbi:protein UmuD-like protein [Klebsiella variicola]|uniref:Protein UmuD-like protein n=1 Tax=Klebsiella variicola TaxID=244366 RepID=A0A7H4MHV4_KLEVA|nr:protein UmuD-like protein [Klebsiella variicola]
MQFTRPTEISPPLMLPLFSERVPCGFPSPAQDYVEDRLDLNKLLINIRVLPTSSKSAESLCVMPASVMETF